MKQSLDTILNHFQQTPKGHLVLNLTNLVTMYDVAQVEKSLGGAPMMSNDTSDACALAELASAIYFNIGTINHEQLMMMKTVAMQRTKQQPITIDLVGVGCSKIRNQAAFELLPYANVIKGNFAEIYYIVNRSADVNQQGVDGEGKISEVFLQQVQNWIQNQHPELIVLITGEIDFIISAQRIVRISGGVPTLAKIVGTGCMLGGIVALCTTIANPYQATINASIMMKSAGYLADVLVGNNLGAFKTELFNQIHQLSHSLVPLSNNVQIQY